MLSPVTSGLSNPLLCPTLFFCKDRLTGSCKNILSAPFTRVVSWRFSSPCSPSSRRPSQHSCPPAAAVAVVPVCPAAQRRHVQRQRHEPQRIHGDQRQQHGSHGGPDGGHLPGAWALAQHVSYGSGTGGGHTGPATLTQKHIETRNTL